jgi:hypothetical protein
LLVPFFKRELVVGDGAGTFMVGPLTEPWFVTGFVPLLRIRLPLPSLAFDTPYCAAAEVPQANMQKIANVIFMCPP